MQELRAKQTMLVVDFKGKAIYNSYKSQEKVLNLFSFLFVIEHSIQKTVFFHPVSSHVTIIDRK